MGEQILGACETAINEKSGAGRECPYEGTFPKWGKD